jgi:hypothetical protein
MHYYGMLKSRGVLIRLSEKKHVTRSISAMGGPKSN